MSVTLHVEFLGGVDCVEAEGGKPVGDVKKAACEMKELDFWSVVMWFEGSEVGDEGVLLEDFGVIDGDVFVLKVSPLHEAYTALQEIPEFHREASAEEKMMSCRQMIRHCEWDDVTNAFIVIFSEGQPPAVDLIPSNPLPFYHYLKTQPKYFPILDDPDVFKAALSLDTVDEAEFLVENFGTASMKSLGAWYLDHHQADGAHIEFLLENGVNYWVQTDLEHPYPEMGTLVMEYLTRSIICPTILRALLRCSDLTATTSHGRTHLMLAAASASHSTSLPILLELNAPINPVDIYGKNALHYYHKSISSCCPEELLLPLASRKDNAGRTPLMLAVRKGLHGASAKYLLQLYSRHHEAMYTDHCNQGETFLTLAVKGGGILVDVVLRAASIYGGFLDVVNHRTYHGFTPLHLAVRRHQLETVKLLLAAGASHVGSLRHATHTSTKMHILLAKQYKDRKQLLDDYPPASVMLRLTRASQCGEHAYLRDLVCPRTY